MFKHILFPTDGSEYSKKALAQVKEIALNFQSRVTVLHAYEFVDILPMYSTTFLDIGQLTADLESVSQQILDEAVEKLTEAGIQTTPLLINGSAKYAIIDAIKEGDCDLVIMGSRGWGPVESVLMGSVSNYILHHTKCPVWLVH